MERILQCKMVFPLRIPSRQIRLGSPAPDQQDENGAGGESDQESRNCDKLTNSRGHEFDETTNECATSWFEH